MGNLNKGNYFVDYTKPRKRKKKREPVRTLADFAREKGVTYSALQYRMKVKPLDVVFKSNCKTGNYYKLKDLEAWHASFDNSKLTKI